MAEPVQLDDEIRGPPEEIDLEAADRDVHLGRRHSMPATQAQKATFEVAAGLVWLERLVTGIESENFGSPERLVQTVGREHAAEIVEGARRRGDWDCSMGGRDCGAGQGK
ncbi:MAG: hypothetical protein QOG09_716 [Solirubrobacterales bacterium]|jgi:hypothetical protein|nr:hypothetical protein [Solirubrobacterales bacterium]